LVLEVGTWFDESVWCIVLWDVEYQRDAALMGTQNLGAGRGVNSSQFFNGLLRRKKKK
jgi:hypothetical protein